MVVVGLGLCLYLQWERAKQWESRAEYMQNYFRKDFAVESIWTGNNAGVEFVRGDPYEPSNHDRRRANR